MFVFSLVFFFSIIFSQDDLSNWGAITSYLTPTGMALNSNGITYASTEGGLLQYDKVNDEFTFIGLDEGLVYLDLSSIALDSKERIWLGGNKPRGCLQVYDPEFGLVEFFEDALIDSIGKIVIDDDMALIIYKGKTLGDFGILKFNLKQDGLPEYKDYFNNFSDDPITQINDVDVSSDSIYVTTDKGLFSGNKEDNLKFSSNWHNSSGQTLENLSLKHFIFGETSYLFSNGSIHVRTDNVWSDYCSSFSGNVLQVEKDDQKIGILTDEYFHEYIDCQVSSYQIPFGSQVNTWNSNNLDFKTYFTSFLMVDNDEVIFGIKDHGISFWSQFDDSHDLKTPNTPIKNVYNAIVMTESGALAGTSHFGTMYKHGDNFFNFVPDVYEKYYNTESSSFNLTSLNYTPGDLPHVPITIMEKNNGNLFFCNSGVLPGSAAILELNLIDDQLIKYDDEVIDGWDGIYQLGTNSHYMLVNQIEKDDFGNMWVVNPFCEKQGHLLAVQSSNDDMWSHVLVPDDKSYLPQTIALETIGAQQRIWLGFSYGLTNESNLYSEGGLKVLNSNNILSSNPDTNWISISNPNILPGNDSNASVWSIVFDRMGWLWVMNEKGIRAYEYVYDQDQNSMTLEPQGKYISGDPINFLSSIAFVKGNRIKVDEQNNKWIITHDGIWVIKENMMFWPSEEGINVENSSLLSSKVYDVAFDDKKGLAYFSTDKGISILEIPFSANPSSSENIYISPNPFIIPDDHKVRIGNVYAGSVLKIMTINGRVMQALHLDDNETYVEWDGRDRSGNYVGSAVYLVSSDSPKGNKVSKISIIRK